MRVLRLVVLSGAHAGLAAYFARMAQQWLSVSSGRVSALTLMAPSNDVLGMAWAAAIAGALLGPVLHMFLGRAIAGSMRPRLMAAACGVGYALAVLFCTIVIAMPWIAVTGRAPGESIASALTNAVFLVVLGTPILMATSTLLFAPILVVGGAAIGMVAMAVERRLLPSSVTPRPYAQ
jgi:hypothetical protein